MPQQPNISVENNFSKGYLTEFTGLNFPENASTDTRNCVFNRIGNVNRRLGIDYETNNTNTTIDRASKAISNYKWKNVGGDGLTQVQAMQVGTTLYFFRSSTATTASPVSAQKLASTIDISSFVSSGSYDATLECTYADGNGYLFVYHPSCDPFYCTYSAGTITATIIKLQIRDFEGLVDGLADTFRPSTITALHQYNIQNQGWTDPPAFSTTSTTTVQNTTGSHTWIVGTGLSVTGGTVITITGAATSVNPTVVFESGTVSSYNSGTGALIVDVTSTGGLNLTVNLSYWTFSTANAGKINTWRTANSNYPANSDVWWLYKNTSGVFSPSTTTANITLNSGPAPKGFYILDAFSQNRAAASGVTGLTTVSTTVRPSCGTWFQGRVWYAGVNASVWSEKIYFSQIIERVDQFGKCYQTNDPTSENFFDLLPIDGGVIKIQGCGAVYKLFPMQNGLIVFAANGVWYITGSQGIGFAANDYTVNKLSSIQSISATSFVDVNGVPMWWNEEGIYTISMQQNQQPYGASRAYGGGGMNVEPITFTTIQTFYSAIPLSCKKYARGDYDPLNWEVRWVYTTTEPSNTTTRYQFDGVLTLNTTTQAFSPWTLSTTSGVPYINGVAFIQGPGGSSAPSAKIKYISSKAGSGTYTFTFADERSTSYVDWHTSGTDYNYTSYFITGYKVHGKALSKFQSQYVRMFLNNSANGSYKMQGIWDYALTGNSGRFSSLERTVITDSTTNFGVIERRHRIRGRGLALQFKVTSVDGAPFDIIGWAIDERINTSS